jgi:hypothetical protein
VGLALPEGLAAVVESSSMAPTARVLPSSERARFHPKRSPASALPALRYESTAHPVGERVRPERRRLVHHGEVDRGPGGEREHPRPVELELRGVLPAELDPVDRQRPLP